MSRGDRYEQDRFVYERDRDYGPGPGPRSEMDRDRFVEEDRYYMRGGRGGRDYPPDDYDRYDRYDRGPPTRTYDDDYVRDRRPVYEEPRFEPRREPAREPLDREFDRRVVITDRERDYRDSSPRRRPRSDIFDRRPEYPPPARFEDVRRDPMPPPPRPLDPYDDERYAERVYYRDDDRGRLPPEHVHEREIIRERERERDRSRESRGTRSHAPHSHHSHRSHSVSSRSSSHSRSGGGTSVRSEYPKKGKTRIPARLVSKKVIIDIGYPYTEEGTTIIIQRALGQDHIDEILRLSEEYIKKEVEITVPARSSAGDVIEERREEVVITSPPPQTIVVPPPPEPAPAPSAPVIIDAGPRPPSRGTVEVVDKTVIREGSPHRHRHHHHHHHDGALIVRPRSRSRSRSRSDVDEWRTVHRGYDGREIIRTERMEDGQLVVYEEVTERISAHKPPRIEKDKKGPHPGLLRAMMTSLT